MSPNVTCGVSLESYHQYLPPKKVSKIPKIECVQSGLPKNAKNHFGCLGPLGVKHCALFITLSLIPKGLRVFFLKTASKQPLLKTR
jgi:hypothetical protein